MEGWVAAAMLAFDREVIAAPGSCLLFRTRVVEEVGGFDPRLPPSEDWDFCYRVATRYRVAYVREVLVRYRIHGAGAHMNIGRMQNGMLLALEKAFASGDASVQRLHDHGIDFNTITVLTADSLAYPDELFDFFVEHVVASVGFNVEEVEGPHVASSLAGGGTEGIGREPGEASFGEVK